MNQPFVNVINVIDAANAILSIDTYFIKSHIQEDAKAFIDDLKKSLDKFNHPFSDKKSRNYSPILLFDEHLNDLIKAAENAYNILTDEGKDLIKNYIKSINTQKNSTTQN